MTNEEKLISILAGVKTLENYTKALKDTVDDMLREAKDIKYTAMAKCTKCGEIILGNEDSLCGTCG